MSQTNEEQQKTTVRRLRFLHDKDKDHTPEQPRYIKETDAGIDKWCRDWVEDRFVDISAEIKSTVSAG